MKLWENLPHPGACDSGRLHFLLAACSSNTWCSFGGLPPFLLVLHFCHSNINWGQRSRRGALLGRGDEIAIAFPRPPKEIPGHTLPRSAPVACCFHIFHVPSACDILFAQAKQDASSRSRAVPLFAGTCWQWWRVVSLWFSKACQRCEKASGGKRSFIMTKQVCGPIPKAIPGLTANP